MPPLDDGIMAAFLMLKKVGEICDKLLHSSDPDAIRHATKGGKTVPPKIFSDHLQNAKN